MTSWRLPRVTGAAAAVVVAAVALVSPSVGGSALSVAVGAVERFDPRLDAILPPGAALERVADGLSWAEGPLWDPPTASLLFSDVPRNVVLRWRPRDGVTMVLSRSGYSGSEPFTGREPGSNGLAWDRDGRLVLAQHGDRRIARLERDGRLTTVADRYEGRRLNSPNDLTLGPNGDIYFTDPPFGLPATYDDPARELPFEGVYRVSRDGRVTLLTRELDGPNGIAFSPDLDTLYVANARPSRPVWLAFDVRGDGTLGPARLFADARAWVRDGDGLPDGLKTDRAGNVFATGPGGIHVFAPDGTRLGRIITGVPTGNLNWGDDGTVLYVTANHWICRIRTSTGATRASRERSAD